MNSGMQENQRAALRFALQDLVRAEAKANGATNIVSAGIGTTSGDVALKRSEELRDAILQLSVGVRNMMRVMHAIIDDL